MCKYLYTYEILNKLDSWSLFYGKFLPWCHQPNSFLPSPFFSPVVISRMIIWMSLLVEEMNENSPSLGLERRTSDVTFHFAGWFMGMRNPNIRMDYYISSPYNWVGRLGSIKFPDIQQIIRVLVTSHVFFTDLMFREMFEVRTFRWYETYEYYIHVLILIYNNISIWFVICTYVEIPEWVIQSCLVPCRSWLIYMLAPTF